MKTILAAFIATVAMSFSTAALAHDNCSYETPQPLSEMFPQTGPISEEMKMQRQYDSECECPTGWDQRVRYCWGGNGFYKCGYICSKYENPGSGGNHGGHDHAGNGGQTGGNGNGAGGNGNGAGGANGNSGGHH
ncbi:hypothetical protein [Bdellovibrio svalbardensis]|uniref:Uncharacterized protein n=1 Tax=Bdellovibrio svalbardensis TaxID=2972972 RepID=A0ABT6DJ14_9BACT|nr:hypothetical protein [Bdellovibrio svalbardensis]MDG0816215.1 hypothetical protein [Bdellovibrio svalbardensis]